jgi:hypothetical protein
LTIAGCRKSELFRCSDARAQRVVKAAALSYEKPWAVTVWLRRLLHPSRQKARAYGRRRRSESDTLMMGVAVCVVLGAVIWLKPTPPSWLLGPAASTMWWLERF